MGVTLRSGLTTMDPSDHLMDLVDSGGGVPLTTTMPFTEGYQETHADHRTRRSETVFPTLAADVAQYTTAQREQPQDEGFTLVKRRIAKREPASTPSLTKTVYPEYTINELRSMTAPQLSEFVTECIKGVRCPICKKWGKLIPSGKIESSQSPIRYWRCGGLGKRGGCGKMYPQSRVVSLCLQAGKKFTREIYLPNELTLKLSAADITLTCTEKVDTAPTGKTLIPPAKSVKRLPTQGPQKIQIPAAPQIKPAQPQRQAIPQIPAAKIAMISPATGGKNLEKFARMYDDAISIITDPKSSREDITATGGILKYLRPRLFNEMPEENAGESKMEPTAPKPAQNTYAARAAKNLPAQPQRPRPVYSPMLVKASKIQDPQERAEVSFRAISTQKKRPISRRVIRTGTIENEFLRDQIQGSKFLYVKGITRQPIRNVKKALSNAGIDVTSIYDISFVGRSVCSILCRQEDAAIIAEVINSLKSRICILEDFDPREPGVFSPEMAQAEERKTPVELLIRRAAYSAVKTNNMIVATAFQAIIPAEFHQAYAEEIAIIENERAHIPRPRNRAP